MHCLWIKSVWQFAVVAIIGLALVVTGGCGKTETASADSSGPSKGDPRAAIANGPLVKPFAGEKQGLQWLKKPTGSVHAGSKVKLAVKTINGFVPGKNGLLISCGDQCERFTKPPFEVEFEIPKEMLGPIDLTAFALDDDRYLAACEPIKLSVVTSARISSLSLPKTIVLIIGLRDEMPLRVKAMFDDGVSRELDPRRDGLNFTIADPDVALVSETGVLKAVGVGETVVTVTDGICKATETVAVINSD